MSILILCIPCVNWHWWWPHILLNPWLPASVVIVIKEDLNKSTRILVDNHLETYLKEHEAPCHHPSTAHSGCCGHYLKNTSSATRSPQVEEGIFYPWPWEPLWEWEAESFQKMMIISQLHSFGICHSQEGRNWKKQLSQAAKSMSQSQGIISQWGFVELM